MAAVVQAHDLSRRFGKRWAYAHIELEVQEGERILLIGANGSGKTTLLRTLGTLLFPTQGELRLFGKNPRQERSVRSRIGLMSHASGLYEDLSAMDNLRIVGRLIGKPATEELLHRVRLEVRPDPVRTYSAGMRKRVGLAALILKQPDLMLLDEPFGQLDPGGMDELTGVVKQLKGTVIIASHQIERAAELCDRAILLNMGLHYWTGPADKAWAAWQKLHHEVLAQPVRGDSVQAARLSTLGEAS